MISPIVEDERKRDEMKKVNKVRVHLKKNSQSLVLNGKVGAATTVVTVPSEKK